MRRRYIVSPEAGADLVEIWRHLRQEASVETADRVESVIREKIVYRPETRPLQVVAILHGNRQLDQVLKDRL